MGSNRENLYLDKVQKNRIFGSPIKFGLLSNYCLSQVNIRENIYNFIEMISFMT